MVCTEQEMEEPDKIDVRWVEDDYREIEKYLPSLQQKIPGQ